MNNVVDEVLNTAQTDNKVKYKIIHADSTEEIVQLELYTPVTTEGTALNKLLFDSIADDINSRLLISNKATTDEAIAGTNDTKYIVPSTLQGKIDKMNKLDGNNSTLVTGAINSYSEHTIFQSSQLKDTNFGTVTIDGYFYSPDSSSTNRNQSIKLTGTNVNYNQVQMQYSNDTPLVFNGDSADTVTILACQSTAFTRKKHPFKIIINYNTKTGIIITSNRSGISTVGNNIAIANVTFDTLTNIKVRLGSPNNSNNLSQVRYSIAYSR